MIALTSLPFPPTNNHRMIPIRGRLILAPAHRDFKKSLSEFLHENYLNIDASGLVGKRIRVTVVYSGPLSEWYTKDGRIKKKDVDNRHKSLLDGIFPFLDLDDSQIFKLEIRKKISGEEMLASVFIEEMGKDDDGE